MAVTHNTIACTARLCESNFTHKWNLIKHRTSTEIDFIHFTIH